VIGERSRGWRHRRHPRWKFLPVAALLVVSVTSSAAKELDGFGDAKLRTSADAVKKIFPALKPAGGLPPANLTYYELANQKFLGLEPCALRFNFFRDQLYEIQFDCGRDAKVIRTLKQEFGDPTIDESYGTFWYWDRAVLGLSRGSMVFGLSDRALSGTVQQAIAGAVAAENAKRSAPPAGAAPAPAK
jgi:hypothetical protein